MARPEVAAARSVPKRRRNSFMAVIVFGWSFMATYCMAARCMAAAVFLVGVARVSSA